MSVRPSLGAAGPGSALPSWLGLARPCRAGLGLTGPGRSAHAPAHAPARGVPPSDYRKRAAMGASPIKRMERDEVGWRRWRWSTTPLRMLGLGRAASPGSVGVPLEREVRDEGEGFFEVLRDVGVRSAAWAASPHHRGDASRGRCVRHQPGPVRMRARGPGLVRCHLQGSVPSMQARSIGSASQLSHRAAAARSANTNSARSSPKPLTWPKRWNLTESDHVAPGRAGRSARSRWNVKGLSIQTGSTALKPGRKRTRIDGAEDGRVVRSERGDGA